MSQVTRLPHLHAVAAGSLHKYVAQIHDSYSGNVVRISPDELSFIDPQAWPDIYSYRAKGPHGSPPPKHFARYPTSINGYKSLILDDNDTEHARVRRIFNPAFSDRALTQQAPLFNKYVDQLVRKLQEGINRSENGVADFDLAKMYSMYCHLVLRTTYADPAISHLQIVRRST